LNHFFDSFDENCFKMFESLAIYLRERSDLTDVELKLVEEMVTLKKLRKRQYLLQEGDVSKNISFIVKGCLRLYWVGKDDAEHILRFGIETWWISDFDSFHSRLPSKYNIDALEDSELLMIEKDKYDHLLQTIPNFQKLINKLETRNFEVSQERILSNISKSPQEKYDNFLRMYPQIHNRVPLHMVASFLGVSRETLSRVRQQFAKRN
jgi:CRP-like cAMP-binding protein